MKQHRHLEVSNEYLLKVLSGPNVGASVLLDDGAYLIGSSLDCDIVLRDEYVAPVHVAINIMKDRVMLDVSDHPVRIGGALLSENTRALTVNDVFTLGLSSMSIGLAAAEWPDIILPRVNDPEYSPVELSENHLVDVQDVAVDESELIPAANDGSDEQEAEPEASGRLQAFIPGLTIPAGLLILAALLGQPHHETGDSTAQVTALEEVQQVLDLSGSSDYVAVSPGANGMLAVEGYVSDYLEAEVLKNRLASVQSEVVVRVYDSEKLAADINTVISQAGVPGIRVTMLQPGVAELSGYAEHGFQVQQILTEIKQKVNGIKAVKNNIATIDTLLRQLRDDFVEYNLQNELYTIVKDSRIFVRGNLTEEKQESWHRIKTRFYNFNGGFPELVDETLAEVMRLEY